jgi:hypothetical protein
LQDSRHLLKSDYRHQHCSGCDHRLGLRAFKPFPERTHYREPRLLSRAQQLRPHRAVFQQFLQGLLVG